MNPATNLQQLKEAAGKTIDLSGAEVKVRNWQEVRSQTVDILAWSAALSPSPEVRAYAAWILRVLAQQAGNGPASINEVYMARGRGELPVDFSVPAINVRAFAYHFARSIFRVAKRNDAGAVICELARSEMGYTDQPPMEYVSSILAGALREGYPWPVFIQGDHFQVNAKKYAKDPGSELGGIKKLIADSIAAGYYNIDIDTSTLVDLSKSTLREQQELNCATCYELTKIVRGSEPKGMTVSLGGEIGEVGGKNSTIEELEAFMDGYMEKLPKGAVGLSKISVQTGTSHGGVVLPDGTMAQVKIDFETLRKLSERGREKYHMGGAVQHGASTLPVELFDMFPKTGTCEIHLATEFQNIMYEHQAFPADLKKEIYAYLDKEAADERKPSDTDSQFYYKTRKKAIGPFKRQLWELAAGPGADILTAIEDKLELLFKKLNTGGTGPKIKPFVKLPASPIPVPGAANAGRAEKFEGDD